MRHFEKGCPILAFFARVGGDAARYLICYDPTWINKLAAAFPTPALRKEREGRGTHCFGHASEINKPGPPAQSRLHNLILPGRERRGAYHQRRLVVDKSR